MDFPFYEEKVGNSIYLRTFQESVECGDLTWHRDREDRYVEAIHDNNWSLQLDNQLPQNLNKKIFIPKGVYHRLIKGKGDLTLKIEKLN